MSSLAIAQLIVQMMPYGIRFVEAMLEAIHKRNPTLEDWRAALQLSQTPFSQGMDISKLVPDTAPTGPTILK